MCRMMGLTCQKYPLVAQDASPGGLKRGSIITEVQVAPPLTDLYIRFWRVLLAPPPSSMPATNTALLLPTNLAPRGAPVICTSRMKVEPLLSITGPVQLVPLSE